VTVPDHKKPQGRKGPIARSGGEATWTPIAFLAGKAERELFIARSFVEAANRRILGECSAEPAYRPFGELRQNPENDLDFTLRTRCGDRLLELAEFAPLREYGPRFENVPSELDQGTKSDLLMELLRRKSQRQGGPARLLLIYVTEHAFWVDPATIELTRRALLRERPLFERIYFLSPGADASGRVWEIFPAAPHFHFGTTSDRELRARKIHFPNPRTLIQR
jgi:hypothetical protein